MTYTVVACYWWAMTLTCKVCSATKGADEFYASNRSTCKDCAKARAREYRGENIEYYRDYDKRRYQEDPMVRERHRRYQNTEAGKASMRDSRRKWLSQNPEKRAAHVILNNRLRRGDIKKPDKCQDCGSTGRIHGHHHDYTRPLDVEWLCALCHSNRHKG